MNVKKIAPLVIALILGLFAALMAMNMVKNKKSVDIVKVINGPETTPMVVAKRPIEPGTALSDDDLTTSQVDAKSVKASSYTTPAELLGRVTAVPIVPGEAISAQMLAPIGSPAGLQAVVPLGMRAVTMEINEITGVAGNVTPGCRVDVLQTLRDAKTGEQMSRTILQNVKVSTIGVRHNPNDPNSDGGNRSATLLVTPRQAQVLELACMTGRPRLSLRGGNDLNPVDNASVTMEDLRGSADRPGWVAAVSPTTRQSTLDMSTPTTRPMDAQWTMQIIRGGSETLVKFNLPRPDGQFTGFDPTAR